MNNEEKLAIVQRAIALCEFEIGFAEEPLKDFELTGANYIMGFDKEWWTAYLNSRTTHLAEFREHENNLGYCISCLGEPYADLLVNYPCNVITTKAQRLLGESL